MLIDLEPGSTTCNDEEVSDYGQRDEPTWEATVEFLDGEKKHTSDTNQEGQEGKICKSRGGEIFPKKAILSSKMRQTGQQLVLQHASKLS